MPNVELSGKVKLTAFRKIALGTWQTAYDPSIYGTLRLRVDKLVDYTAKFRERFGKKLTITHVVAKAVGIAMRECPDANALLRFNKLYYRKNVDVSFQVLLDEDGKKDLSAAKVDNIDQKGLVEIIDELDERAAIIRARKDKELESTRQSMRLIPAMFINLFIKMLSFLLYTLNINLKWAGVPKDAFGSAFVTSIGSLGLQVGYVPLVPYSRIPLLVAPGAVAEEAIVEDGEVRVAKVLLVNATFDHRVIDGAHAMDLASTLRRVIENPFENLDPLDPPQANDSVTGADAAP